MTIVVEITTAEGNHVKHYLQGHTRILVQCDDQICLPNLHPRIVSATLDHADNVCLQGLGFTLTLLRLLRLMEDERDASLRIGMGGDAFIIDNYARLLGLIFGSMRREPQMRNANTRAPEKPSSFRHSDEAARGGTATVHLEPIAALAQSYPFGAHDVSSIPSADDDWHRLQAPRDLIWMNR